MKIFFTGKCWKLMKICAAQGLIAMLICGVSMAHTNYAQVLDREVTVDLREVSFENALATIASQTNTFFSYSHDLVSVKEKITLKADRKPLADVLNILLLPHGITYVAHHDNFTIFLKKERRQGQQSLMNTEPLQSVDEQRQLVTGKVADSNDQPMVGVNIVVKGTANGTTSDTSGNYSINAEENDILVFSFIGYSSVERRVGDQAMINIVLNEDIRSLKEVVINAGYWQVKEKEQTGNIGQVTSRQIAQQPVTNPLQSMQGRMAGVYIQQSTGIPGGQIVVQIRGQNSLRTTSANNGNLPLYIVDGVPFTSASLSSSYTSAIMIGGSPLSNINPTDIESIEVLKDADATAIYGSRGANGVILIKTKRGAAGKTKFDFNITQGFSRIARKMDLLSTPQYVAMRKEAFRNDNAEPQSYDYDITSWDTTRYTDWQQQLIGRSAHVTDAQASLSGGNTQTQFMINGALHDESTVFPGDFGYQKFSGNSSLVHTSLDKKFSTTLAVNYSFQNNRLFSQDLTGKAMLMAPNAPAVYDSLGKLNWPVGFDNPYSYLLKKNNERTSNLITSLQLRYEVLPGLNVKSSFGYTQMELKAISMNPAASWNPAYNVTNASSIFADNSIRTWIAEPQLEYEKILGPGKLTALAGLTFQQNIREGMAIAAAFTSDSYIENIQAAFLTRPYEAIDIRYNYNAVFTRLNYNLHEKYLLNLTARRDGSSRFGPGKQFSNFGAAGAAWIFSRERFLENNFLSFGKLRASYGSTGSDQIGDYQYMDSYVANSYSYNGITGLRPTRLFNQNYSWEVNRKAEVGLELGFKEDRIFVTASAYRNRSSNQLIGYALPPTTGFASIQMNQDAVVQNTGLEFELRTQNMENADLTWSTAVNLTLPQNKLISYPNLAGSSYATTYAEGKSIFTAYTYEYNNVDPNTGYYTFNDRNADGAITFEGDRTFTKRIAQQYYGGFQNTVKFRQLELDFLFQFVKQQGRNYLSSFGVPGLIGNQPSVVLDRWQQPGDAVNVQRFSQNYGDSYLAYSNLQNSTAATSDASFIRLKNVSLSWTLPSKWTDSMHLRTMRVYALGQNLLTFTSYLGLDPENQSILTLPPLRTCTFGIQLGL